MTSHSFSRLHPSHIFPPPQPRHPPPASTFHLNDIASRNPLKKNDNILTNIKQNFNNFTLVIQNMYKLEPPHPSTLSHILTKVKACPAPCRCVTTKFTQFPQGNDVSYFYLTILSLYSTIINWWNEVKSDFFFKYKRIKDMFIRGKEILPMMHSVPVEGFCF